LDETTRLPIPERTDVVAWVRQAFENISSSSIAQTFRSIGYLKNISLQIPTEDSVITESVVTESVDDEEIESRTTLTLGTEPDPDDDDTLTIDFDGIRIDDNDIDYESITAEKEKKKKAKICHA
jgi:hypothetical protein